MNITVDGGKSKRLLLGGTYCEEDIVLTAVGGSSDTAREKALVERTLTEYANNELTELGNYALYRYETLTSVYLPKLDRIRGSVFRACTSLINVYIPLVRYVYVNAFLECSALQQIDLPSVTTINQYAFKDCSSLSVVIIRNTKAVCTLDNTNIFDGTPFATGNGTLVVPSALLDEYKQATNWSVLHGYGNQFVELEGSEYE